MSDPITTIATALVEQASEFRLLTSDEGYAVIAITDRLSAVLTPDVFNPAVILWELTGHIADGRLPSQRSEDVAGELASDFAAALSSLTIMCQTWADR